VWDLRFAAAPLVTAAADITGGHIGEVCAGIGWLVVGWLSWDELQGLAWATLMMGCRRKVATLHVCAICHLPELA
jgi:hypothetical protein